MTERMHIELVDLLRAHIETYDQLEALLLLARDPDRTWSVDAVAAALRLNPSSGSAALDHLTKAGVLVRISTASGERFHCHPDSSRALHYLTRADRDDQVQVMKLMSKNALDRVRSSALRTFAAALRLGRK